jgi:hypothetical protein
MEVMPIAPNVPSAPIRFRPRRIRRPQDDLAGLPTEMADFLRVIAEIELSRVSGHVDAEVERETAVSRAGQVPGRQESVD